MGRDNLPLLAKYCVGEKAIPRQLVVAEDAKEGDQQETEKILEEGIRTNVGRPENASEDL